MTPQGSKIAPDVFDLLDQHIAAMRRGEVEKEEALERDDAIIAFCHSFFEQFFASQFGYEVIVEDQKAKKAAARIRIGLDKGGNAEEAQRLVAAFEELCDLWPDVLGSSYAGPTEEAQAFHTDYIPLLLTRIRDWSEAAGHKELSARATAAATAYDEVVNTI